MAVGWRSNYLRYKSYFLDVVGHYQKRSDLKMFMELFLSIATISIFGIFAIRPTLITIAELIKEIEGKKTVVASMNEKIENLNNAQSLYGEERANIDLLKIAIPKEGDPQVLVRQLEGIASQNPVRILSLTLGDVNILGDGENATAVDTKLENLPEGASGLTFTISSSSDYPQIASFVQAMEKLRNPFKWDTIIINSQESETGKELILVINARSPYLK